MFNAYIAKTSKRNPNIMLEDRREITEGEILFLIEWWLRRKLANSIRKEEVLLFDNDLRYTRGIDEEIAKVKQIQELGDCLWMIAGLARTYGYSLEEVAQKNLDKLSKRKQAGTIIGDGDGIYNR